VLVVDAGSVHLVVKVAEAAEGRASAGGLGAVGGGQLATELTSAKLESAARARLVTAARGVGRAELTWVFPAVSTCARALGGQFFGAKNPTALKRFVRLQNETPRKREVLVLPGDLGEIGCMGDRKRGAVREELAWRGRPSRMCGMSLTPLGLDSLLFIGCKSTPLHHLLNISAPFLFSAHPLLLN
jgi:hypothetical protein